MEKNLVVLFCLTCLGWRGDAQTPDPFGDVLRRMEQQMLRGLPPMDSSGAYGQFFAFPADSAFSFRFDTTFSDGSGSFFFHFSPGQGGGNLADPLGLEEMMRRFFDSGDSFDQPFFMPGPNRPPGDDGTLRQDGDLLPEERLRQQEQQPATPGKNRPAPATPAQPKTGEIKTIRI